MSGEKNLPGFDHMDIEFLLRQKGLDVSAELASDLQKLEDSLKLGVTDIESAISEALRFSQGVGSRVVLKLAVLEARVQALEAP